MTEEYSSNYNLKYLEWIRTYKNRSDQKKKNPTYKNSTDQKKKKKTTGKKGPNIYYFPINLLFVPPIILSMKIQEQWRHDTQPFKQKLYHCCQKYAMWDFLALLNKRWDSFAYRYEPTQKGKLALRFFFYSFLPFVWSHRAVIPAFPNSVWWNFYYLWCTSESSPRNEGCSDASWSAGILLLDRCSPGIVRKCLKMTKDQLCCCL